MKKAVVIGLILLGFLVLFDKLIMPQIGRAHV